MAGLLLAGVALCAALIMVAALAVIRGWRRGHGQPLAPASARGAAGPAGKPMAPHQIAIVPGFSDAVPPGPAAQVPVPPGQAAHPQARPAPRPQPGRHGPGPPPDGQRAIARAAAASEQIASYYDQADKPMADYLTALGWAHQPPHSPQPPGPAGRTKRHPPASGGREQ